MVLLKEIKKEIKGCETGCNDIDSNDRHHNSDVKLYEIIDEERDARIKAYIAHSCHTADVCTNAELVNPQFQCRLKKGIKDIISKSSLEKIIMDAVGYDAVDVDVFHILRGGMSFDPSAGLYSLMHPLRATVHFVSSQREQLDDGTWITVEDTYKKLFDKEEKPKVVNLFFGDIVATGISLQKALEKFLVKMKAKSNYFHSLFFFTIGSKKTEEMIEQAVRDERFRDLFRDFTAHIIYLEGRFGMAAKNTPIKLKKPCTDLLVYHEDAIIAPEFADMLLDSPVHLLEKCVIYDGGARAYTWKEHMHEVINYWKELRQIAMCEHLSLYDAIDEKYPIMRIGSVDEWLNLHPSWKGIGAIETYIAGLLDKKSGYEHDHRYHDTNEALLELCDQRIKRCEDRISGKMR